LTQQAVDRKRITFRAAAASDQDFLSRLYASTRADEMDLVPWTDAEKSDFLRMQFAAQTQHYAEYFTNAAFNVVELERQPIGRLIVDRNRDVIHIIDIALVPQWRGRGIGKMLLCEILDEARDSGRTVTIHVEHFNPAMRLYERLGFKHIDTNGVYHLMEWRRTAIT
jgi:ribosomal protein S18 acetylase RimI-like enzyme